MYKKISVEAENNELILKNSNGDHVIIPANKRAWVMNKLKEKCHSCIDSLVENLPIASQYAEIGGVYESIDSDDETPNSKKKETSFKNDEELKDYIKAKQKLGHRIPYEEAIRYIKLNNLKGEALYDFVSKNVKQGFKMANEKEWSKDVANPNYVPPITQEEILNYKKHLETIGEIKKDPTFDELKTYLEQNKYIPNASGLATNKQKGYDIIEMARKKGITPTLMPNGTYQMMDDENTFTQTNQGFGKVRTFHPDAIYNQVPYVKGNDIVNYYQLLEEPKYNQRLPTQEELADYESGHYMVGGLTPEFNKVYIDQYLDPSKMPKNTDNTAYSDNLEMIKRYKEVKDIADQIKSYKGTPEYKEQREKEASSNKRKQILQNFTKPDLQWYHGQIPKF